MNDGDLDYIVVSIPPKERAKQMIEIIKLIDCAEYRTPLMIYQYLRAREVRLCGEFDIHKIFCGESNNYSLHGLNV